MLMFLVEAHTKKAALRFQVNSLSFVIFFYHIFRGALLLDFYKYKPTDVFQMNN